MLRWCVFSQPESSWEKCSCVCVSRGSAQHTRMNHGISRLGRGSPGSQNRRMVALEGTSPSPCRGSAATQQVRLEQGPSSLACSACRDGHPQLLWAAAPGPHLPLNEEFYPNISPKYPLFLFKVISCCAISNRLCIKSVSLLIYKLLLSTERPQ